MSDGFDDFGKMFDGADEVQQVSEGSVETETQGTAEVEQEAQVMAPAVQTTPQQKAAVQSKGVSDDFEIGFSDEMLANLQRDGVSVEEIGVKISRVPIERYKASTSKVDRIAFITSKVIPIKFHYIEGVGSIMCFHGKCCELAGTPTVRYLFPIAVYQTDTEGNISGGKVELKMLSAGEDFYKQIQTIAKGARAATKGKGGIDHIDLLVTCTDDQYQKISLTFGGMATWRQYKSIAEFLRTRWLQDGDKAYMAIARKVDEKALLKLMNIDVEEEEQGKGFDNVSEQDFSSFFA